MKKALVCAALLLICALIPTLAFTEDAATVRLARTIYALADEESYETKLAIGTVVVNRVESPWFAGSLEGVLTEQHQFPCGSRYDDESLEAAHAVLSGRRTLPDDVLYYHALNASEPWPAANLYASSGSFGFYTKNGDE